MGERERRRQRRASQTDGWVREGGRGAALIEGAERSRAGQLSDGCLDSVRGGVAD